MPSARSRSPVRRLVRAASVPLIAVLGLPACSLLVDTSGLSNGATASGPQTPSDGGGADGGSQGGGDGATPDAEGGVPAAADVLLAAGGLSTCAARGKAIWCWGDNASGQLGDGTMTKRTAPTAVLALSGADVTAVGVGETHTCAVVGGDAWCWGAGGAGQLGDGRKADSTIPVKVASLPGAAVTAVSAGTNFSCAVAAGTAYCWGTNGSGQVGNPIGASAPSPVSVTTSNGPLTGVADVSCGQDHACALLTSGDVYCWGHNDNGTLGSSALAVNAVATKALKVEGLPGPAQKVAIAGWHACAIVGGAVWCWGTGTAGELGNGGTASSSVPVAATGLPSSVTTLAIGGGAADGDATCAVRAGAAMCWGNDQSGRLGDGQTSARGVALAVSSLPPDVVSVAAGYDHACVLRASREIRCWGQGKDGELGDGAGVDRAMPVAVTLPPP